MLRDGLGKRQKKNRECISGGANCVAKHALVSRKLSKTLLPAKRNSHRHALCRQCKRMQSAVGCDSAAPVAASIALARLPRPPYFISTVEATGSCVRNWDEARTARLRRQKREQNYATFLAACFALRRASSFAVVSVIPPNMLRIAAPNVRSRYGSFCFAAYSMTKSDAAT